MRGLKLTSGSAVEHFIANFLALLNKFLAVCKHSVNVCGNIPGPEKYQKLPLDIQKYNLAFDTINCF